MAIASFELSAQEIKYRRQAGILSLVVSVLLLAAKFWAHELTGSQAILSDALESIVNVVAAALALFVVHYASQPKDQDHPYGHGKMEYFSAAFEGGLITFAAVYIIIEAINTFFKSGSLQQLDVGLFIVAVAGAINLALGWFLLRRGAKTQSVALRASGHHVISDFWTSLGVVVGLLIVYWTGLYWIDALIALIMGLVLAASGLRLVRESAAGLLDKEDLQVLESLAEVLRQHITEGIIQIHHARVIRSGWYHHIDAHIVLPEFWTVERVHEQVNAFEKQVIKAYPYGGEMNFHFDPCGKAYCKVCEVSDCPIRIEKFESRMPVVLEHLRSPDEPVEFRGRRN